MSRQRRKPSAQTFAQVRKAALRRWDTHTTPGTIAFRLDVPTQYVHAALAGDVRRVVQAYEKGVTAESVGQDLELPPAFVAYVFRRINAIADNRKRLDHKVAGDWIARATDPERTEPMAQRSPKRSNKGRGGRGRRGCRAKQPPTPPVAAP